MSRIAPPARLSVAAVILLLVVALVPVAPAAAATTDAKTRQLEQRRRDIERKKAAAAAEVDVLRASDEKLGQSLSTLNRDVRRQEAAVASAKQASASADAEVAQLRTEHAQTTARQHELRGQLRDVAVDAYIHGPTSGLGATLGAKDLTEAAQRQQLLRTVATRQTEVADELRSAEQDLVVQQAAADAAAKRASDRKKAVQSRLGDLKTSLSSQQRVAADIEDRLEARLGEADALEHLSADVAGQIKARQAELARLVASRPSTRASRGGSRIVASGDLATVRGITVAASVAPRLAALLDAADADELSFGGGGYRDPQSQVAVRRANCGSSNYDIYEKPASQCSPPTARPGASMHEQGLAIDFTLNGALITSRSNPGFRWLAANAGRFGLSNLPEEPWHWSTNGR